MEHNELDKLFRDIIRKNDANLSKKEQSGKEEVWQKLELPNKRKVFPIWKIAAAILLLLLCGTSFIMLGKINKQEQRYAQLAQEHLKTKEALLLLEKESHINKTPPMIAETPVTTEEIKNERFNYCSKRIY